MTQEIRPLCGYLTNAPSLQSGDVCKQVVAIRYQWRGGWLYCCEFHAACLAVSVIELMENNERCNLDNASQ